MLQSQCTEMINLVQSVAPDESKEWLTTREAAQATGLKPQTTTNYASNGRFKKVKKDPRGRYLVHRSELAEFL